MISDIILLRNVEAFEMWYYCAQPLLSLLVTYIMSIGVIYTLSLDCSLDTGLSQYGIGCGCIYGVMFYDVSEYMQSVSRLYYIIYRTTYCSVFKVTQEHPMAHTKNKFIPTEHYIYVPGNMPEYDAQMLSLSAILGIMPSVGCTIPHKYSSVLILSLSSTWPGTLSLSAIFTTQNCGPIRHCLAPEVNYHICYNDML